ncbi:MAG: hypothetical protein O2968_21455 [Acidobacteria bacterium]|nr:hypothetical protein [Acidobacteriota bacterium]
MSEGVRRLSLLLGILGACVGAAFGLEPAANIYSTLRSWHAYEKYEQIASDHAQMLSAWEEASEHISIEADGQAKFVKSDPSQGFSEAWRDNAGSWYQQREGNWVNAEEGDPLGILEPKFSWWRSISGSRPVPPVKPCDPRKSRPGFLPYLGVIALPLVGFLIPWGTVRSINWVVMGFITDRRGKR